MRWKNVKRDPADIAFSRYIRLRAGWRCEKCKTQHEEGGLQCSHFIGRRNEAVRFDDENCKALCGGCHMFLTANPQLHRDWMLSQLGEERYKKLILRSNTYHRKDRKMALIIAKAQLAELEKRLGISKP